MREEEFSVGTEKRSSLFGCLFRLATVAVAVSGKSSGEGKATHPSILAWEIPWTEEPSGQWT